MSRDPPTPSVLFLWLLVAVAALVRVFHMIERCRESRDEANIGRKTLNEAGSRGCYIKHVLEISETTGNPVVPLDDYNNGVLPDPSRFV